MRRQALPQAQRTCGETLQIPPIKFYEKGEPRQDVIDLYLANVRYQELLSGDLRHSWVQFGMEKKDD